jgi:DNA-binding transcriptional regulator YiaG
MARPTFDKLRKKALRKPGAKAEYAALAPVFQMKRQTIALRHTAGLTQQRMAENLGTSKGNISQLESVNSEAPPSPLDPARGRRIHEVQ